MRTRTRPAAFHVARVAALSSVVVLAACSWGSIVEPDFDWEICSPPTVAAAVSVTPSEINLRLGFTYQLQVRPVDSRGEFDMCAEVRLTSSDPATVSVSTNSVVTAVSSGVAIIRATSGGVVKDTVVVTVVAKNLGSVAITSAPQSLLVGQTIKLGVDARDTDGNVTVPGPITWRTEDGTIATITNTGTLIAVGEGTATVTAEVEGITATARIPVRDEAPTRRFHQIAAGFQHTCAIVGGGGVPEGTAYCWGDGLKGQLGVGGKGFAALPLRVAGGRTFTFIAAANSNTCAITASGETYCWGDNAGGQLGDGTGIERSAPVRVVTTQTFRALALGGEMACGLTADGAAYCWGRVGTGTGVPPTLMPGGIRFTDISGAGGVVCGRTAEGRVYCWGSTYTWAGPAPTASGGGMLFSQISAGPYHVCGVALVDGAGYCWGRMDSSPLGRTVPTTMRETPIAIPGGLRYTTVSAGGGFTCGVTASGASCLGATSFASGNTDSSPLAVPREPRHRFATITSGQMHSCAIDTRGGGWCWGRNFEGQVGAGEPESVASEAYQLLIR